MLSQILVNSILSTFLLSLVAVGFNLIFNSTKVFHLAHGAMYVCAVYSFFAFNNFIQNHLTYVIAIFISITLSLALISILIFVTEILVYRPLHEKNANPAISLISSLGVYMLVVNIITFYFGNESVSLHSNIKILFSNDYFKLTDIEMMHIVVSSILLFAVMFFSKSKFYTQIRAVTDNYQTAEKFGINVRKTRILSLVTGTVLVGVAGIMKGYEIAIEPNAGLTVVLLASVAVIVGGVNSLKGTVIACLVIALIDNYSVKFLSAQWKEMLTYTLLVIVLVFNQQGLISVKQRIETR